MCACSWHSSLVMALMALFVTPSMVLADHKPDGSSNTVFVGEQRLANLVKLLPPGLFIQRDDEPLHPLVPGNSIPKIINRPGTPEDYSFFKLKDVPEFPLNNGPSSYPEHIPISPIINAILNLTDDATQESITSFNPTYDAPAQVSPLLNPTYDVVPGAVFFPQDPLQTYSSYSEVPASSDPVETPSEGVEGEVPYNGFFGTWWKTGSFQEAAAKQTSHLWKSFAESVETKSAEKWKGFTKAVGKKVAKKSKKILIKAAPIVKTVIGAKAVASLFQGAGINAAEVGDVAVPTVVEYLAPSATYGALLVETKHVEPEVIQSSYSAPAQAPQPTYGVPPQAPQPTYGAPSQAPQPLVIPAVPENSYEASRPAQPQIVPASAQLPGFYSYIPPQASHLFRNQGKQEEQSDDQGVTKPRQGAFGIVDGVEEKFNPVYNIYQYGLNLADQATHTLSSLWPGNWFRSTDALPPSAPVASHYEASTVESHYSTFASTPAPAFASVPAAAPLPAPVVAHSYGTAAYK